MPQHDPDDEDWYDDTSSDLDADLEAATLPCPECGTALYDDTDHCPQCGHWLTEADHRALDHDAGLFSSRRVHIIALALLVIFALGSLASVLGM